MGSLPSPRPEVTATPFDPHGGDDGSGAHVLADLSVNRHPLGPPAALVAALRDVDPSAYPDPSSRRAREAAAIAYGAEPGRVALGNGTAELIHRLADAWLRPGDGVVVAAPTFGEYARAARLRGAAVHAALPYGDPSAPDPEPVEALVRAVRPVLAFVCAPNNPTGHAWSAGALERLARACRDAGALLVLDLAYAELALEPAPPPPADALALRSLTKAFAVPGVRCGLATGPAPVIDALRRAAAPWQASAHAQAAAEWALGPAGRAWLASAAPALRELDAACVRALAGAGLEPRPSAVPFRLVDAPGGHAREAAASALRAGVRVRDAGSFGLPALLRVATRPPDEIARLVDWAASWTTLS